MYSIVLLGCLHSKCYKIRPQIYSGNEIAAKMWKTFTITEFSNARSQLCHIVTAAYKHADGKKIDGRRIVVDVERGRTVKNWKPRRLGKI